MQISANKANERSLITNKTCTIGVILPKILAGYGFDVHTKAWQDGIIESLERKEFDVIVSFFENRFTKQNNIMKLIAAKEVDGLVIMQPDLDDETVTFLEKSDVPYVFLQISPRGLSIEKSGVYLCRSVSRRIFGQWLKQLLQAWQIAERSIEAGKLVFQPVQVVKGRVMQRFGLFPFLFQIEDESDEVVIPFEESFADAHYVLTATTNHPVCYAAIKQKTPEAVTFDYRSHQIFPGTKRHRQLDCDRHP